MTAKRIRTKVLIDTFVQWSLLCVSGLIAAIGVAFIDDGSSLLRHAFLFMIQGAVCDSLSRRSVMRDCSIVTFHGMDGNEDSASRDLELVAAARAGSNAAFEELKKRYSHRLYRRIQCITQSHEHKEDALQETFLRTFVALDSFEGISQFASWLTRIAINSALLVLRRRRRRTELSFERSSESCEFPSMLKLHETALNPEQLDELCQRPECALNAISKLTSNFRTPMTTWIEQECSMKDVARTHDLSLPSVKSRLHRARKQLTRSMALMKRVPDGDSSIGLKRRLVIPAFQNRELPCLSFD